MIGWFTDNPLSKTVMQSIPCIEIKHIKYFDYTVYQPSIFYGILRGCARAMHILKSRGIDFYYIDNGYFDAKYVDKAMHKEMDGMFRVVKNGMHDVYPCQPSPSTYKPTNTLVIPPSPYSANYHDTTPEDWTQEVSGYLTEKRIRKKDTIIPLLNDIMWADHVIAFNSIAVMEAIKQRKMITDTHGCFRNTGYYNYDEVMNFYSTKQYRLGEIRI